jgi:chromatin modification-related protein EAF6
MSSSFGGGGNGRDRDGPSGAPTPSRAGGGRAGATKKSKKNTPAAAMEDSETDGREAKKARTSFGARK